MKYTCMLNNVLSYICSEGCLNQQKMKNVGDLNESASLQIRNLYVESVNCENCNMLVKLRDKSFSWATLHFCSHICLGKYAYVRSRHECCRASQSATITIQKFHVF